MITAIRNYFAPRRTAPSEVAAPSGRELELTPFYVDLQGYAGIAEQVPLSQLPELMNAYFDVASTAITSEGGTIDKFIGDVVVAMFGAPVPTATHARQACSAAVNVQREIARLRERLQREGDRWPPLARQLRVRIGLNSGPCVVGDLGTADRFNYTMLGDNVNLAARLADGAKSWGVWTLCTDATRDACERVAPGEIFFRRLGQTIVKGRTSLVTLYEPLAFRKDVTDTMRECVAHYEAGLARLRERDWDGAHACFQKSAPLEPHQPDSATGIQRNPSTVSAEVAVKHRAEPPPEWWPLG